MNYHHCLQLEIQELCFAINLLPSQWAAIQNCSCTWVFLPEPLANPEDPLFFRCTPWGQRIGDQCLEYHDILSP